MTSIIRAYGGRALWVLPLLLAAVAVCLHDGAALNHDAAWLFIAAGRLLAGGSYVDDVFEVNMPLAIAIYIPARLLASLCDLNPTTAIWLWVFALTAQCVALLMGLVRIQTDGIRESLSTPTGLSWLIAALLLVPGYHFAQREHLIVVLTLPFVFLIASPPGRANRLLRCYISVLGAIGFFIKPHYAGLPALLLLYAALRTQSLKPLWSCETAALLVIGCANLALVLWWYPGWLTCARWATDLYGAYQRSSMSAVLAAPPFPIVATSALLVFTLAGYRRDFGRAGLPLILMSGYGILAYCFQAKGWAYQLLPSTIPLFILIGLATGYSWNARHESPGTRILTACAMSVASLAAVAVAFANTPTNLPRWSMLVKSPIGQAFAIASPGDHVYAFSTTMVPVFPTVLSLNLQWSSRFPSLWPLAGIEWHRQHPDAEDTNALASYSTQLKQMVLADLRRDRPGVVLLDRRVGQFGLPPGYDILGFFLDDAGFRALWRDYRIIGEHRDYIIYARRQ